MGIEAVKTECIIWPKTTKGGYGYRYVGYGRKGTRQKYAHRLAYEEAYGPIPDGMFVCHACNNKACVNVDHLYLADCKTNTQHAARDGLLPRGEQHGSAKLKEEQVKVIKQMRGSATAKVVAEKYEVSVGAIYAIWNGYTWREV